jgi:hypothetical protein
MTPITATHTDRLQEFADRIDLADLLGRQGLWLDELRFDETAEIFTEDATATTPGGRAKGREALVEQARRNHARYALTHHTTSNVLIDLDGDRAVVRANLVAYLVRDAAEPEPTLTLGSRYRFEAVRTEQGWRFASVEVSPVWRFGEIPPVAPSTA